MQELLEPRLFIRFNPNKLERRARLTLWKIFSIARNRNCEHALATFWMLDPCMGTCLGLVNVIAL
jgi:hypothetical protein